MDCSVQYTVSGACPKQEIRERGRGMDTVPRVGIFQLNEMAPWTTDACNTVSGAVRAPHIVCVVEQDSGAGRLPR